MCDFAGRCLLVFFFKSQQHLGRSHRHGNYLCDFNLESTFGIEGVKQNIYSVQKKTQKRSKERANTSLLLSRCHRVGGVGVLI